MKPQLIGITGHANAGKDTFADELVTHHDFVKMEFARKLKEIISDLYDVPLSDFYDRTLKNTPHPNLYDNTPREAAQRIGTEGFRNLIGASTWIDYLKRQIVKSDSLIVISDVRFPDEFDMIVEMGGTIIGISRDDVEYYLHESEAQVHALIAKADIIVSNKDTLDKYRVNISRTIESLGFVNKQNDLAQLLG